MNGNAVEVENSKTVVGELAEPLVVDADFARRAERQALLSPAEFDRLEAWEQSDKKNPPPVQMAALCLSGGGIRSASFCLGVIQALAQHRLLSQFHYLSTVSGGGYIGSWLTRLITEHGGNVNSVETLLANTAATPDAAEPTELRNLRSYTNYLTPTPGLASPDAWAGLVLWVRNTLINWAVFLPLALAVAGIPVFCLNVVCWGAWFDPKTWPFWLFEFVFGGVALAALAIAVCNTCLSLPSHLRSIGKPSEPAGLSTVSVWRRIAWPTMIWVFLAPLAGAPLLNPKHTVSVQTTFCGNGTCAKPLVAHKSYTPAKAPPLLRRYIANTDGAKQRTIRLLPGAAWIVSILAYILAGVLVRSRYPADQRGKHVRAFVTNFPAWFISTGVSAGVLMLGAWLAFKQSALWIAMVGPPWVLMAELLRSAVYVAVRTNGLFSDLDREWLARLNGDKLRLVLGICLLGTTAVWLSIVLFGFKNGLYGAAIAGFGVASGPVAAWLGKTASTIFSYGTKKTEDRSSLVMKHGMLIAAALFGLTMFMLLGRLSIVIAGSVYQKLPMFSLGNLQQQDYGAAAITVALLIAICIIVAFGIDRIVNLNRFSMHAVYRNRLIRAFLGTARSGARKPDPYTAFDPCDNIRMPDTWENRVQKKLFHIVNVSLNYTSGKDTARAERKAKVFTISPLHCGSPALRAHGAYVPTAEYACGDRETGPDDKQNGITLGTAMAISGAAASPNMGYNSSAPAAFLMTLFNVRLGAWLANPGSGEIDREQSKKSGPTLAIPTMLQELTGRSDDQGNYVYLSDGGHFDNLGLYEMLRRRCSVIIVADAGADLSYAFFDLGHTLDIALVDFGVRVTFEDPPGLTTGVDPKRIPYAIAKIFYLDGTTGRLIYIKPCRPEPLPIQLAAYGVIKPDFPHESTIDQFFTESDFECYRQLGEYITNGLIAKKTEEKRCKLMPKPPDPTMALSDF